MACDVCNRDVPEGEGYALTTEQVVTSPKYWEFLRRKFGFVTDFTVRMAAGQRQGWMVCNECIKFFDVDVAKAREYCQKWWSSGKIYHIPGAGPASLESAFKAANLNERRSTSKKKWWEFWK
jgi:hypothetical protein